MAILIITNNLDFVADNVIDWIHSFGKKVFRFSFDDFLKSAQVSYDLNSEKKLSLVIDGHIIESGWLRKETDEYKRLYDLEKEFGFKDGYEYFKFLKKEMTVSKQILLNGKNLKWLCDYKSVNVNKIEVLEFAQEYKLKIPKSIVTNNVDTLSKFINKNKIERFIVKSIGENLSVMFKRKTSVFQPVKSFGINNIQDFPDSFLPTLFQEEIDKRIEIRIFFINNSFYSMAIDSTTTDSRLTDDNTKYYPFQLPKIIEKKLLRLMNKLILNYGSIDLIVDKKNNYCFLEVTPTGEFSFLINNCNFNIEEEIAKYLCYGN